MGTSGEIFVIEVGRNEKALRGLSSFGNFDYIIADLSEREVAKRIRKELERGGVKKIFSLITPALL